MWRTAVLICEDCAVAGAVKQFPKTKIDRDGNYTIDSLYWLNCNWCVRVCKLKRQNNCTKPKCCVQQSVLTVILILYFRSQQGEETGGRGKREKANEAPSLSKRGPIIMYMYNCICRVYGAKASELNFSINMDWWLHPHRRCAGIVNSRWIKHIASL